ncbi:nucleotide 5'-monophosphate nucleosidase PpnN [Reinekea thalattae]|uniref:AMP nucleosidase n=1 Tax=Reinekea thalattae TaxID=2593301 RepID=A0A5C8ZAA4_9GAMM|nr:nucleotide 5'-monophosphate nucleosidase PpnN [Reinekea thalattae]TXR54354.1 LOG family protein [Reinekea thalattae]
MTEETIDTSITAVGSLEVLSQFEVTRLKKAGENGLYDLLRRCVLAILNTGSDIDNTKTMLETFPNFHIDIEQQDRGIRLNLINAPKNAFVDGKMIRSTQEMVFSALRDIVYTQAANKQLGLNLRTSSDITDYVFQFLRNAHLMNPGSDPRIVVCWGGHSINKNEYKYTKDVGHELGLRGLDICTGCGPGAMKGPMKGATISHAKQRIRNGRYIGLTEPGIIAAEAPNPIVNELAILPDIEKRLEAFVRLGHGIIIFPGGVGTAEELLYILGILLHPDNQDIPFPLVLTGPKQAAAYFEQLHAFIGATLGPSAQQKYRIIVDDKEAVAQEMAQGMEQVKAFRKQTKDAFHFNWHLNISEDYQHPFEPNHENMANLRLHKTTPTHELAADLRRAFSGIVAGNVKDTGILAIEQHGPFEIHGDQTIMQPLDALLCAFVEQQRMKLPGTEYQPCYKVVT